jgi:hypothetical protein
MEWVNKWLFMTEVINGGEEYSSGGPVLLQFKGTTFMVLSL